MMEIGLEFPNLQWLTENSIQRNRKSINETIIMRKKKIFPNIFYCNTDFTYTKI